MPLVRLTVRNEFGLGRPELYGDGTVEDEDPKEVLGGVAVAGLVGILRQLGDLAEFAAEVFHGMQEQVTVTASRCQKLTNRARRIESALSPLEKAVLSQTSHIHLAYTASCEWHPLLQNEQNNFIYNDLPLFVMESYEQCRDPPRLHLLDKFDVGGPGSCLRRYSDPTFFRKESSDPVVANDIKVQRDKSYRKSKKKRLSQRKIPKSRLASTSEETSGTHPSSLTDVRQTTSQSTSTNGVACISNMQELSDEPAQTHLPEQSDVQEPSRTHDSRNDSGYIEYFIHQSPMSEHEENHSEGLLAMSPQHADSMCSGECKDIVDDNIQYHPSCEQLVPCASFSAWDEKKETPDSLFVQNIEDEEASEILESKFGPGTPDNESQNQRVFARMDILFDEVDVPPARRQLSKIETTPQCESDRENQSERGSETESRSEADEYVDARNTIESESDNDLDGQPKQKLEHYLGDMNTHHSEDVSEENIDKSGDIQFGNIAQDVEHDYSNDKSCSVSHLQKNEKASYSLSVPVPEETMSSDKNFQEPGDSVDAFCSSSAEAVPAGKILREESAATYLLPAEAFSDERISTEESVAMYSSLTDTVPHNDISPVELVAIHPLLTEAFPDVSPEESVSTDQSLEKSITQERISPEEPITTGLLSAEASLYERILPEESINVSPSVAEAIPLKKILSEEPVVMYPLLVEAFPDESPEEPVVSMDLPLAKVVSHEKFSVEEPVTTYLLPAETFSDERISPEESVAMYTPLAETVLHKDISPVELVVMHPLLAEAFPDKSPEEPIATEQSLENVAPQEKISPEEHIITTCPLSAEVSVCERSSPEESIDVSTSIAEAIPLKKVLSKEPIAMYPLLAEAFPDESSEEPVGATDLPLANVTPHEKFSVEEPVPMYPFSAESFLDERISPEESIVTYSSLADAVIHEKILSEESVASDPLLAETFPDEGILPEEPLAMDLSLEKAIPREIIPPEEPVAMYPSSAGTIPDVKNSLEESDVTYPSLAESVPHGNILLEAADAAFCSDRDRATDEPHTTSSVAKNRKSICNSPKPESTGSISDKTIPQEPPGSIDVHNNLKVESLAPFCSPSIPGNKVLDANCPLPGGSVQSCPDARESLSNTICVESVAIWSNGSLLGLEPSKPPVFAVPSSVHGDGHNKNNGETNVNVNVSGKKEPSDGPVENIEKLSDPSPLYSSGVGHNNGSHQQSNAMSFGVFGLSHRLLMNGFRRNLPACNYEALPACSNTEEAMEDVIGHGCQETRGRDCESSFDEPFGVDPLFVSPTSSPPLEHMKISFSRIGGLAASKLKLKIPSQPQNHERKAERFPLFQLVPETASPHNNASESDDDNDTFCRSSPCMSVSCRSEHSVSDSELWESDGNLERKDGSFYNELCRLSPGDLASSIEQIGDKNTLAGIGMEPSLSGSFLDIPCFDAVNCFHAIRETKNVSHVGICGNLPSHVEPISSELLGSPEQDKVPEPEFLEHACSETPKSTSFIEPPEDATANGKQFGGEEAASTSETKQSDPRGSSVAFSPPTKASSSAVLE